MGKLTKHIIRVKDATGKYVTYPSDISVDPSSGVFRATLPEEITGKLLKDMTKDSHPILDKHKCSWGYYWNGHSRNSNKGLSNGKESRVIYSTVLEDVKRCLEDMVLEFIAVEITTEKVIVYKFHGDCTYWLRKDGNIAPNGLKGDGGEWKQMDRDSYNDTHTYSVGFYARVFDKETYHHSTGISVLYKEAKTDLYDTGLNSFVHVEKLIDSYNGHNHKLKKDVKEIAWSEEYERKCCTAMINMCKMQESLSKVFAHENPFLLENKFLALSE